jgi:hypothetical protein
MAQQEEERTHNDLQHIIRKTTIYNTLYGKQQSTTHYTENNNLQHIIRKTTIYNTLYGKQQSTTHYTENNDLQHIIRKTTIYNTLYGKQRSTTHHRENWRSINTSPPSHPSFKLDGPCSRMVSSPCSTCATRSVLLLQTPW